MPRYHFDLSGRMDQPDPTGTEFSDLRGAQNEAFERMATLLTVHDPSWLLNDDLQLVVTDEHGLVLFRLGIETETLPTSSDQDV